MTLASMAGDKPLPTSARGMRTRAALVDAARVVFGRDGYVDARIVDICEEAKVAVGSFYTYFGGKEEVFTAVFAEVQEEMLHPDTASLVDREDVVAVIEASNRRYLELYRRNAALLGAIEQVSTINESFRALRRERAQAFAARNARSIRRLQKAGLADKELDPDVAARAVAGMVGRLAYGTFVLGDKVAFEKLVATTTRLWANALQIPPDARLTPARRGRSTETPVSSS